MNDSTNQTPECISARITVVLGLLIQILLPMDEVARALRIPNFYWLNDNLQDTTERRQS